MFYKRFLLLLLPLGLAFFGCNKDTPVRGVDLIYRQTFEIPAGLGIFDVHHFYLRNIPTHYVQVLNQYNIDASAIAQVITAEGALSGQFGDANLDFIDKISVRAFDENDPTNYLEIGYRDPAPLDPGNTMGLIPSLADSKEFFSQDRVSLDVVIWLRYTTPDSYPVQLDLKMKATY